MIYSELIQVCENLNSLSYFVENSIDKESHHLKILDLKTKINNLSELIKSNENKFKAVFNVIEKNENKILNSKYLAGSKESAVRKASEVLKKLTNLNFDLENYGFLSLGGGDGTELYSLIENSNINFGLLLEYDHNSVNNFIQNILPFKLKNFDRWDKLNLEVIECDLFDKNKLKTVKEIIKERNLNGIIISIHAVLHELSNRSQLKSNYSGPDNSLIFEDYFSELFEWHDNIIIIVREPGVPENWGEYVNISIGEQYLENFKKILEEISNIHFSGTKQNNFDYFETQNYFKCKSSLAIESLIKLFYFEDYEYEKYEQITSISRDRLLKGLMAGSDRFQILQSEPFFTDSIASNMAKYEVRVKTTENMPMATPQCFTYTIAKKGIHLKK